MARYVGLLRGINVGGHKKVPMAQLREALAGIGWTGVRTHLQSGNVVFTVPGEGKGDEEVRQQLERVIAERFGFDVPCLVRTGEEVEAVAAACPYPDDEIDPAKLLVLSSTTTRGRGTSPYWTRRRSRPTPSGTSAPPSTATSRTAWAAAGSVPRWRPCGPGC
jgi:hypothetical protein